MKTFTCHDKATLVEYLYGEVDPAVRAAVEEHLASCEPCAAEVTALGDVRSELGLWVPPDVELGFTIVKKAEQSNLLRPAQWWTTVPAWAQAAAAILVLAAAAAIANVQVRSGPEGFSVSTGWLAPAAAPAATAPAVSATAERPADDWRTALASLEQQLRHEIRAGREQDPVRVADGGADEATLRRVRQLLAESEQRQQGELALRFTQFTRDMNMQRRADLMKITQGFGDVDERMLRQRQMINNVIRVSGTPQQ